MFYRIKKKLQVKTNGKIYTAYRGKMNGKSHTSVSEKKYKKPRFQYMSTTGNEVSLVNLMPYFDYFIFYKIIKGRPLAIRPQEAIERYSEDVQVKRHQMDAQYVLSTVQAAIGVM